MIYNIKEYDYQGVHFKMESENLIVAENVL